MKILLTTPVATTEDLWGQYAKGAGYYFPIGLLSIAGMLRNEGHIVKLLDTSTLSLTADEFKKEISLDSFDIIGLGGCYTALSHLVFHTAMLCREIQPDCNIVLGGIHPTLFPEETLTACPEADFVIFGEGELTFCELADILSHGKTNFNSIKGLAYRMGNSIAISTPRPPIEDLGIIPPLPYDLIPVERYIPPASNYLRLPTYGMMIQRGCPYQCIYCDPRVHGRKVRQYPLETVIQEIRYLVDHHGMRGILFHDSAFTVNMKFAEEFCKRMIQEGFDLTWTCYTRVDRVNPELLALMKKAGCWAISYGIESGNPESLILIKKGTTIEQAIKAVKWTKKAGIQVIGSLILCLPGEDETMTLNTIRFAHELHLDTAVFFLPVPFPGTDLYDVCKNEGGLIDNIQWEDFREWMDPTKPLYINPKIGKGKMIEIYNYAIRSFYLSPATLFRMLTHIRSLSDIKKYIFGFKAISGVLKRSIIGKFQ